jgi:tRNA(fMet)-specific endonuclease VapC
MKKYLLDTVIWIHYLKNEYQIPEKIELVGLENCYISEITLAELEFGIENSAETRKAQNRHNLELLIMMQAGRIVQIRNCFQIYGKEKARLKRLGQPISDFDLLIGASAVANEMIMVTRNAQHLARIEHIVIENWVDNQ